MDTIFVYSDGGCRGNGKSENIGAWAYVLKYKDKTKEGYGARENVTNNQMELLGAIKALEVITKRNNPVIVTMDSAYVVNGINLWCKNWIKNNWQTKEKEPVKNQELWMLLLSLVYTYSDIKFIQCKGHADNELNNRADFLVNFAMDLLSKNP